MATVLLRGLAWMGILSVVDLPIQPALAAQTTDKVI